MSAQNSLTIAAGVDLPREVILSKVGIVGMSGSGKTQTARKLAETMLAMQQHISVLDPTGAWFGLRSSADGLRPGYPIVVFGGRHGDAPLKADAGRMLAKAMRKERFNAIFDLSRLGDPEIRAFSRDFLAETYLHNSEPLHVFMDEFDIICPQAKTDKSEEVRAVVNTFVRRGRIRALGSTMITQNPQDADKSVLNMADIVIAMRTQGSQAIDAIGKWMGRNLDKAKLTELMRSLPELPTGRGWIWAPQVKLFKVEQFLLCETFDSGQTPKLGQKINPPKVLARVDIQKLGAEIEAQVKQEQETDPKALKDEVARLRKELAERGEDVGITAEAVAALEAEVEELRPLKDHLSDMEAHRVEVSAKVQEVLSGIADRFDVLRIELTEAILQFSPGANPVGVFALVPSTAPQPISPRRAAQPPARKEEAQVIPDGDFRPNGPQQKILNAIATLATMRIPYTDALVAVNADTLPRARGFEENMRILKVQGLVARGDGRPALTESGVAVAVHERSMPTFANFLSRLKVTGPQSQMLGLLKVSAYGIQGLAEAMGTTDRSRGFEENVRQLRRLDYVRLEHGKLHLASWLGGLR